MISIDELSSQVRHFVLSIVKSKGRLFQHIGILLLYLIFVFLMHWSLLLGENLMKWDIFDAEYGFRVLMSDAVRNFQLPLWNPLVQYGTPFYAVLGMPVWYPVTLLMDLVGFSTLSLGFEYAIHLVVAAFGMYLLCVYFLHLRGKDDWNSVAISFIMGAIYASSGLFLSNASHIMFVISASWIPHILYWSLRSAKENKNFFLLVAGLLFGFMFLGGYPEIVYNLFLVLIPVYVVIFYQRERGFWKNIFVAAGKYIMLSGFMLLASMITILPVAMNLSLITRTAGAKVPDGSPYIILLSMLFPGMRSVYPTLEPTIINYYMSIIVLISLPLLRFCKDHISLYLVGGAVGCLFVSFASNSFLYALIYRFAPLYNVFHFSTVWRCFALVFLLMALSEPLTNMLYSRDSRSVQKCAGVLCVSTIAFGMLCGLGQFLFPAMDTGIITKLAVLSKGGMIAAFSCLLYYIYFTWMRKGKGSPVFIRNIFVLITCMELLAYTFVEIPDTVTLFPQLAYQYDSSVANYVDHEIKLCDERNRSTEFSKAACTRSRRNNRGVFFQKTLDEEGYISFLLADTEAYKTSYNRNINSTLPQAFFTSDVIDVNSVDYNTWKNDPAVPPKQIYVEKVQKDFERVESAILVLQSDEWKSLEAMPSNQSQLLAYDIPAYANQTCGLRVYLKDPVPVANVILSFDQKDTFYQTNTVPVSYQGAFFTKTDKDGCFFDVILPKENDTYIYTLKEIALDNTSPIAAAVGLMPRGSDQDPNVIINHFTFNEFEAQVCAPYDGYFVLRQAYHRGWNLFVDGQKVPIEKINQCFMGTYLSAGEHTIEMRFEPVEFYIGAIISIGYVLVVIGVFVYKNCHKKTV